MIKNMFRSDIDPEKSGLHQFDHKQMRKATRRNELI